MIAIGVRELKAHLSRVLRDVQRGETVLVTDRGRVVAELRRPDGTTSNMSDEDRAFAKLAASGHLRVAERPNKHYRSTGIQVPEGTAQALIDALREE